MWVEQIAIEHFGAAKRQRILGLGPRVNVLFGPNEAGKSTVLEFVRSAFFGFRRKSARLNIYEPPDGLLRSGWLVLHTREGMRLRLTRMERRGQREGWLTVANDQGIDMQERWADLFGNGLDRSSYESLFAFDLDGMRVLDQSALRGKIFSAALGAVGVSPLEVMKKMDDRGKRILKCSPREGESIISLQSRLRDVDKLLRELREKPAHYLRLKDDFEAVKAERAAIAEQIRIAEDSLRKLNRILRYEEEWRKLVQVDKDLDQLEDVRSFPHDGVTRLDQALERKREAEKSLWEVEQSLASLKDRMDELHPDEVVLAHDRDLRVLAIRARALAGRPEDIDRLRARVVDRQAVVREEIASLGASWNRERVASADPSIVLEQEIRGFVESWQRGRECIRMLEHSLAEVSDRCKHVLESARHVEDELAELRAHCTGYLPPESLGRLQEWKLYRSTISELQERLAGENRRMTLLTEHYRELKNRLDSLRSERSSIVSPASLWTVAALAATTGAGMLALAWTSSGLGSWICLMIGMCLWLSIPAVVRWKTLWERQRRFRVASETAAVSRKFALTGREIAHVEQARRTITQRVRAHRSEMERITSEVLGSPSAAMSEVLEAEALSRASEEPMREIRALDDARRAMAEQVRGANSQKQDLESRLQTAESDFERLRSEWHACSEEHSLDSRFEPETALSLVLRLRSVKAKIFDLEAEEETFREFVADWEDLCAKVHALAHRMDKAVQDGASPIELLEGWIGLNDESKRILAEKKVLSERIREQELRSGVLIRQVWKAEDQVVNLLEAAAATDQECFRERFALHQRCQSLGQERRVLVSSLTAGLELDDEAQMLDVMARVDWAELKTTVSDLTDRIQELSHSSEELADRSGRLAHEIASLESESETEMLLNEREVLSARLNKLAKEWMVTRLSSLLLRKTLRRYESERQPRVLEKGSEILEAITGGALTKILFPLEGDQVKVQRADGTVMDETLLSRGAQEQMYLVLRLAHLEIFRPSEPLPVLLDDVLVNFDHYRAARTAEALVGFSERTGTQILFFTCHSHIADLFEETSLRISLEPRQPILAQREPGTSGQTIYNEENL